MQIKERKENKILNRVEISFSWKHDKKSTPSRTEVMDLVQTLEPGSDRDLIVVKNCSTRFGQPLTTGLAFIYGSRRPWPWSLATSTSVMNRCAAHPRPLPRNQVKEAMNDGRRSKPQRKVVQVQS